MSKKIFPLIVFIFFISGTSYSFQPENNVVVVNGLMPLNTKFAGTLSATMAFSSYNQPIPFGSSLGLNLQPGDIGVIAVSAPFCDQYLGYSCLVPIPPECILKIGPSGRLIISGLISDYGLDLRSLRCDYIPEVVDNNYDCASSTHHCW